MTIKELYDWALENDAKDLEIELSMPDIENDGYTYTQPTKPTISHYDVDGETYKVVKLECLVPVHD